MSVGEDVAGALAASQPPNPKPSQCKADARSETSDKTPALAGSVWHRGASAEGGSWRGGNGAPWGLKNKRSWYFCTRTCCCVASSSQTAPLPRRSPPREQSPSPFSHTRFSWVCAFLLLEFGANRAQGGGRGRISAHFRAGRAAPLPVQRQNPFQV